MVARYAFPRGSVGTSKSECWVAQDGNPTYAATRFEYRQNFVVAFMLRYVAYLLPFGYY